MLGEIEGHGDEEGENKDNMWRRRRRKMNHLHFHREKEGERKRRGWRRNRRIWGGTGEQKRRGNLRGHRIAPNSTHRCWVLFWPLKASPARRCLG